MLTLAEIKCIGCTACVSVCPTNVIKMGRDTEGFPHPYIAKEDGCVECGKCERVCPVLNTTPVVSKKQTAVIAQNKDEEVRKQSSSGGMFSAIALSVLDEGGVVYGAAYGDDFEVCHIGVTSNENLWKLRGSKYVQSNLKDCFPEIKAALASGKKVCFSGTPCQIEGLIYYLGNKPQNLLLVDVVCHGVSSPLVWERYLETIEHLNPYSIYFRWKHFGYKYSTMSVFDSENEEVYFAGVETDKMLRAYFTNSCIRNTCHECQFKKRYRESDITIWDCFQPRIFNPDFDDDKGTSCVLIHSAKGLEQLERIIHQDLIRYHYVCPDSLVLGNNELTHSVKKSSIREHFLQDASNLDGKTLFHKYFPSTMLSKSKKCIRIMLIKTNLYKALKYGLFLYRRNKLKGKKDE